MSGFQLQLLAQLQRLAKEGYFGPGVAEEWESYSHLNNPLEACAKFVEDFDRYDAGEANEIKDIRNNLCQMLCFAYRQARRRDPAVAQEFAVAFTNDFLGHPGSALLTRWNSLAESAHAFKKLALSQDGLLVWQQASRLFLAYNEFLNGLLGLLIIAWKIGVGQSYSLNVLDNNYGSKIHEFKQLTGGDNGLFFIIFRVAHKDLRNAIAHGAAWLDVAERKVRFTYENKREKVESSMPVIEFVALAGLGSHLGVAYLSALAAITVSEEGSVEMKERLPLQLRKALEWEPPPNPGPQADG
jgi:hypothetical protein